MQEMRRWLWLAVEAVPYLFVAAVVAWPVVILVQGYQKGADPVGLAFGGLLAAIVAFVGYGFVREWLDGR